MTSGKRRFEVSKQKEGPKAKVEKFRVALYARVSTEDQAEEGYSIEAQVERLKAYAVSRDWVVHDLYVDAGYSARDIKRPEYVRMISEVAKWSAIVVMKMDRIHRNAKNFIAMMDLLAKVHKEFVSTTESLDTTTSMGRFVMDIIQRIAQLESEQIGERTFTGMMQKAKSGDYALGQKAPYGYAWSVHGDDQKRGSGTLEIVKTEAEIVRRIYKAASKGESRWDIAKALAWCTCKTVTVKRHHMAKDGTISQYTYHEPGRNCQGCFRVRYILNNPAYVGYYAWGPKLFKGDFPPIVTRTEFETVQKARRHHMVDLTKAEST